MSKNLYASWGKEEGKASRVINSLWNNHGKKIFWEKYKKSDELKRRELLKKLTGTEENKRGFMKSMTLTLFQSYIDDSIEILELKEVKKKR